MTPPLMTHEERQALIRKPFPIVYIPSVKRWGGVQLINDDQWMQDANAWRKRYAANCERPLYGPYADGE